MVAANGAVGGLGYQVVDDVDYLHISQLVRMGNRRVLHQHVLQCFDAN